MDVLLSVCYWTGKTLSFIWKVFLNFFLSFCVSMAGFAGFEILTKQKVMELPNFMNLVLIVALILCVILTVGINVVKEIKTKKRYIEE